MALRLQAAGSLAEVRCQAVAVPCYYLRSPDQKRQSR